MGGDVKPKSWDWGWRGGGKEGTDAREGGGAGGTLIDEGTVDVRGPELEVGAVFGLGMVVADAAPRALTSGMCVAGWL